MEIECWYHCTGKENPADIPSQGSTPSELKSGVQWRHSPNWLVNLTRIPVIDDEPAVLETCLQELKTNQTITSHSLLNSSKV